MSAVVVISALKELLRSRKVLKEAIFNLTFLLPKHTHSRYCATFTQNIQTDWPQQTLQTQIRSAVCHLFWAYKVCH